MSRAVSLQIFAFQALLWGILIGPVHVEQALASPPFEIHVLDAQAQPLRGGVVTFCPGDIDCVEFTIASSGWVSVDRELVLRNTELTIIVYDPDGSTRFAASGWSLTPRQRHKLTNDLKRVGARLMGQRNFGLTLEFEQPQPFDAPPDSPPASPHRPASWLVGGGVGWMVGGAFTADEDALGGVDKVAPGPWLVLGRRLGLPDRWPAGQHGLNYAEITIHYALNRYTVRQIDSQGESDLGFHRVGLALGLGRAWRRTQITLATVANYGGIYDADERLERGGRSYGMLGLGMQIRGSRQVGRFAGRRLSLMLQASAVHYLADAVADDHWYGTAPALVVGVIID